MEHRLLSEADNVADEGGAEEQVVAAEADILIRLARRVCPIRAGDVLEQPDPGSVWFDRAACAANAAASSGPGVQSQMTRHGVIAFRANALLLAALTVIFASSGCGNGNEACSGATRGCVLLSNVLATDVAINVIGYGNVVVPAGTQATPGITWYTVASTVGTQVTFSASQFNPGIDSCVVTANSWADPAKPPQVNIYYAGGTAVRCYNW